MARQSAELSNNWVREDFSQYVAELQLHMALQARNLVPTLTQTVVDSGKLPGGASVARNGSPSADNWCRFPQAQTFQDSRQQLLHQTQATIEKLVSRQ